LLENLHCRQVVVGAFDYLRVAQGMQRHRPDAVAGNEEGVAPPPADVDHDSGSASRRGENVMVDWRGGEVCEARHGPHLRQQDVPSSRKRHAIVGVYWVFEATTHCFHLVCQCRVGFPQCCELGTRLQQLGPKNCSTSFQ
jgi:hypothetical protein